MCIRDSYWGSVSSAAAGYNQDVEGWTYGARGEIGLHFDAGGFFIEPTASLSYVDSSLDDFTQLGATFAFEEDAGLRGRAGGRIGTSFTMMGMRTTAYIGGNYVHEFMGEDSLTFSSGNQSLVFANPQVEDYGEGVIGLSSDSVAGLSAFAEGRYAGGGGLEGYRGRVGLRMRY